jgi:hypothetical protein
MNGFSTSARSQPVDKAGRMRSPRHVKKQRLFEAIIGVFEAKNGVFGPKMGQNRRFSVTVY